jgi:hypothetical protein
MRLDTLRMFPPDVSHEPPVIQPHTLSACVLKISSPSIRRTDTLSGVEIIMRGYTSEMAGTPRNSISPETLPTPTCEFESTKDTDEKPTLLVGKPKIT